MDRLLHERQVVPIADFLADLEVSRATFKRDMDYLRERLHAPIAWDRAAGGYRLVEPDGNAPRYELPGLWFNASEVHALLTMQQLLRELEPGLLAPHVAPLLTRLKTLLEDADLPAGEIERRIRVIRMASRTVDSRFFSLAATGVLTRKRLALTYRARYNDEASTRVVSPQRLVYYRGNWYLDAWCHLRQGLRSFALDRIETLAATGEIAKDVADAALDAVLAAGYGIYSGSTLTWASLRFSPGAARWVAAENWHPRQRAGHASDGSYLLEVPYSDDRELVMDILKYGADVEVIAPEALREKVRARLAAAAAVYAKG